jgi:hypothetical protein
VIDDASQSSDTGSTGMEDSIVVPIKKPRKLVDM